jgi:hypothetical protein
MAERRPFRTDGGKSSERRSDEERKVTPAVEGQVSTEAQAAMNQGKPLPLPSQQVVEGLGHGHSPRIPWPPDKPLEHNSRPFKLKE